MNATPRQVLEERIADLERNGAARERLRILGVLRQTLSEADYDEVVSRLRQATTAGPSGERNGGGVAAGTRPGDPATAVAFNAAEGRATG